MAIQFEPQQEQPQEEKTYTVGDTFLYNGISPYMIAASGHNEVILSCITDGYRWNTAVKVSNYREITKSEFDKITDGRSSEFTQRDFKLIFI